MSIVLVGMLLLIFGMLSELLAELTVLADDEAVLVAALQCGLDPYLVPEEAVFDCHWVAGDFTRPVAAAAGQDKREKERG